MEMLIQLLGKILYKDRGEGYTYVNNICNFYSISYSIVYIYIYTSYTIFYMYNFHTIFFIYCLIYTNLLYNVII